MDTEQFEQVMAVLEAIRHNTDRMAYAMEQTTTNLKAPNLLKPMSLYNGFDWASIGARVVETDDDGVSIVSWGGQLFPRRSAANKYRPAIWYSRSLGKVDGVNQYERLITFKEQEMEASPLPGQATRALEAATSQAAIDVQATTLPPTQPLRSPPTATPPAIAPNALLTLDQLMQQLRWSDARMTGYIKQILQKDIADLTDQDLRTLSQKLLNKQKAS